MMWFLGRYVGLLLVGHCVLLALEVWVRCGSLVYMCRGLGYNMLQYEHLRVLRSFSDFGVLVVILVSGFG